MPRRRSIQCPDNSTPRQCPPPRPMWPTQYPDNPIPRQCRVGGPYNAQTILHLDNAPISQLDARLLELDALGIQCSIGERGVGGGRWGGEGEESVQRQGGKGASVSPWTTPGPVISSESRTGHLQATHTYFHAITILWKMEHTQKRMASRSEES